MCDRNRQSLQDGDADSFLRLYGGLFTYLEVMDEPIFEGPVLGSLAKPVIGRLESLETQQRASEAYSRWLKGLCSFSG